MAGPKTYNLSNTVNEISRNTGINKSIVKAVLISQNECYLDALLNEEIIKIGDICTMKVVKNQSGGMGTFNRLSVKGSVYIKNLLKQIK